MLNNGTEKICDIHIGTGAILSVFQCQSLTKYRDVSDVQHTANATASANCRSFLFFVDGVVQLVITFTFNLAKSYVNL